MVISSSSRSRAKGSLEAPYWVKITRTGDVFTAQTSVDGVTWQDVVVTPAITISMASDVYIGVVATRHAAGLVCGAKLSNISTTGNISIGAWQVGEIGIAQASGNLPEVCYVAIQDLVGKMKVVSNQDPGMIATGSWVE